MSLQFQHVAISPQVLAQNVGDEAVLLDLKTEQYFSLNAVGRRVWQLLQETGDVRAIRDRLLDEFDVDSAALDRDLNTLLTGLVDAGLIDAG
jgi:hypothetical protein